MVRGDTSRGRPHLTAAFIATIVAIAALAAIAAAADRAAARNIQALAGARYTQKTRGLVVQRAAARRQDLVFIFGSSEIDRDSAFHPRELFRDAPTGFSVISIAGPGTSVFQTAQNLAALGDRLRDRKVVVSLSPEMYLRDASSRNANSAAYSGNFSPLHLLTALLNRDVDPGLRKRIGARALDYPAPLKGDAVLSLLAQATPGEAFADRAWSAAARPLAHARRAILNAQDAALVLGHIAGTEAVATPQRRSTGEIDWAALRIQADRDERRRSANNPWHVNDNWWHQENIEWVDGERNAWTDTRFRAGMTSSPIWDDLTLLCEILKDIGARPLLISMPYNGRLWDYRGVAAPTRKLYYARVRTIADRFDIPTFILDGHEYDDYFWADLGSHFNSRAWLMFDEKLDAFYHDALE